MTNKNVEFLIPYKKSKSSRTKNVIPAKAGIYIHGTISCKLICLFTELSKNALIFVPAYSLLIDSCLRRNDVGSVGHSMILKQVQDDVDEV